MSQSQGPPDMNQSAKAIKEPLGAGVVVHAFNPNPTQLMGGGGRWMVEFQEKTVFNNKEKFE